MARARNIKPALFKNEVLGQADPILTLLFQGLWVLADRDGRLEDRPIRIKAEVLPYRDGINVDEMLSWLHSNGFICRYVVDGKRFIAVLNFRKHQNPHKNESPSEIPPYEEADCTEDYSPASEKIGSTRADSLNLIPDSLSLDSGSLINSVPTVLTPTPSTPLQPLTTDEIIFGYGVPLLVNSGTADKSARSFLGGLRKQHGDTALVDALRDCIKAKPLQPLEWLAARLPPKGARGKQSALELRNAATVAELLGG